MPRMKPSSGLLLAIAAPLAAAYVQGLGRKEHGASLTLTVSQRAAAYAKRAGVLKEELQKCLQQARHFLGPEEEPAQIIEKATDYCAKALTKAADRAYVCPHFKEAIQFSVRSLEPHSQLTPTDFCELAEAHMVEAEGATRVPRIGWGSLMHFKVGSICERTVQSAMGTQHNISASLVGDLWYSVCVSQDCAHYLPSRTKWCNIDHQATHSAWVCESASQFMQSNAAKAAGDQGTVDARTVCNLYSNFTKDLGVNVEAYQHVMKGAPLNNVPEPTQAEKALVSSQLLGDAAAHRLRDGGGAAVVPVGPLPQPEGRSAAHGRRGLLGYIALPSIVLLSAASAA